MPPDAPPPTGVIHRFSRFIEGLKRAMAEGIRAREDTLAAMAVPLWHYLGRTLRRLGALHARFAAGTLAPASNRSAGPRPVSDRPTPVRRPPRIPRGPVLLHYRLAHFLAPLRELVDHPEMRALLAAAPAAGRLLRPLWRKLTPDPAARAAVPAAEAAPVGATPLRPTGGGEPSQIAARRAARCAGLAAPNYRGRGADFPRPLPIATFAGLMPRRPRTP